MKPIQTKLRRIAYTPLAMALCVVLAGTWPDVVAGVVRLLAGILGSS